MMKNLSLKKIFVFVLVALSINALAAEKKSETKVGGKVYEAKAEAKGYNEEGIPVVVTVKATKDGDKLTIVDIIAEHEETPALGGKAIPRLIKKIKEKQDYEKVDIIAGATESSKALKEAVAKAVKEIKKQK